MNKTLFILTITVLLVCACGSKTETLQEYTLNDVLGVLDDAGIRYVERNETKNVYDSQREGTERHLYQLESGNLTIYVFSNVTQRREVQRDPFPTAEAVPPNGSYGMGTILVFYYNGNIRMAQNLMKAFEPLGVEEPSQLQ